MAKLDLRISTPYLKLLWLDEAHIYRSEVITDEDTQTTQSIYPDEPTFIISECMLSLSNRNKANDTAFSVGEEDFEFQEVIPKLFCDPNIEILAGDRLKVFRKDSVGNVYAIYTLHPAEMGRPNQWVTHQEIECRFLEDN